MHMSDREPAEPAQVFQLLRHDASVAVDQHAAAGHAGVPDSGHAANRRRRGVHERHAFRTEGEGSRDNRVWEKHE